MPDIDINKIEKDLLDFVKSSLKDAKDDIAEYINSKKQDIISWGEQVASGELKPELLKSMLADEKNVIQTILYKHALKAKIDSEEKATKLALQIAEKLVSIILAALL
jgi:hypothetical protein